MADKPDTLSMAQWRDSTMTVEKLLNIPSAYTVVQCDITVSRGGEIFRFFYVKDCNLSCPNVNVGSFPKIWMGQIRMAKGGNRITIGSIEVKKGDKLAKWISKSFIAP